MRSGTLVRGLVGAAISIVAIGRFREGRIDAEKLLVKCPSKYQGAEVEKAYSAAPKAVGRT
jgi:cytochrome c-type biogenesis protein CcmE